MNERTQFCKNCRFAWTRPRTELDWVAKNDWREYSQDVNERKIPPIPDGYIGSLEYHCHRYVPDRWEEVDGDNFCGEWQESQNNVASESDTRLSRLRKGAIDALECLYDAHCKRVEQKTDKESWKLILASAYLIEDALVASSRKEDKPFESRVTCMHGFPQWFGPGAYFSETSE